MKQKLTAIFLATFLFARSFACINGESVELKDGTFLYEDRMGRVPYGHHFADIAQLEEGIGRMDSLYQATGDIDYLSDKGILLILLKRYDEAIKLYQWIEKKAPNRYSTAANLGTAYELLGQNENALQWIQRAVQIDPGSHNGSEWIHVKILEAKLKGESLYTTRFLLNTDFGSANRPVTTLARQELQQLSDALYYQLNERVSFVKPKDKIVAQLLFDLGNAAFLLGNYHDALADYQLAKNYGYSHPLVQTRISEARAAQLPKPISQATTSQQTLSKSLYPYRRLIAGAAGIVLAAVIFFVRRRKKMTHH